MKHSFTEGDCVSVMWQPDPAVSEPDTLPLMGERHSHTERQRERGMVSVLIKWERTFRPSLSCPDTGGNKDHSPLLPSSSSALLLFTPHPPAGKPFNQPRREYMDMMWENKKEGKTRGRKRRQGERSPLVRQMQ